MTKNHKFVLSMATIAILSGTNAAAEELKVDTDKLKLGTTEISIKDGVADVKPASGDETKAIEVKSAIPNKIGASGSEQTMTELDITAKQAELKVGDGNNAGGSLGGTAPKADGTASDDGYAFKIDTSKVTLTGKDADNKAELNVNQNSSITTSDTAGTSVGANSAINIANGKTLTINGALTTSDDTSNISINGGSLNLDGALTATKGTLTLGEGGKLTASGALTNTGGTITINKGATLNAKGTTNSKDIIVDGGSYVDEKAITNNQNATIEIKNGGKLDAKDSLTNSGTIKVGDDTSVGSLSVAKDFTSNTSGTTTIGKNSTMSVGGKLTQTDGGITLNENANLSVSGGYTGTAGNLTLKQGSNFTTNGELKQTGTTITLGGGTLTANGKATLDGTKLTLTDGGTLNFNGVGAENASTISGKVESADGKALNINLGRGTELTFSDTTNGLNLKNATADTLDKITLGGGTLKVGKLTADATNLNTTSGGTIDFTNDGSKITGDLTLGFGTTLKFSSATNTDGTTFETLTTNGGKLDFAQGTAKVTNLTANATDITFDAKNGGTIELANGGKSTISGNLELGTGANIKIISAASNATAGALGVDKLSVTKTGKITLGGGVLNVAQGLNIANAGATADSEGNENNIDISAGGVINFNGGISNINGKLETTENKKLTLDVNQNAGVNFEDLNLKAGSELSLDGGTINMGALTTAEKSNLSLTKGTLNFIGDSESKTPTSSTIKDLNLADDSTAVVNFGANTAVSIESDLDLSATKANVNFYNGSLVKLGTDSKGTLTAAKNLNLGGQVELGTLVAKSSADSSLLNVGFGTANANLSGKLVGKDTNSPAKFTIGTDTDGNSIIGASGEKVEIGEGNINSALTLKAGVISTNAALTTTTGSKLVFGGGSLNVGAGGSLTIANTGKNLELKDGVGGLITLKGEDGSTGGAMTITAGNLDLSKTTLGIKIENGGKLTTTAASKISGAGNVIALSDYTAIGINGSITTTGGESFEYEKMGDLTLGKDTTLVINTRQNADGDLQTITAGKFTTADTTNTSKFNTATLAFGTGSVKLTGATTEATKLNNSGFADKLTLGEKAVLEFSSGSVNVKGALATEGADKTATLKVSGARANLEGGFDTTNYVKTIELNGGALNIKQDTLTATGLDVTHIQTNASGISSVMNIDGEATITNSTFAILPLGVETGATSYMVLSTTKGLTISDINPDKTQQNGTRGEFRTRNSLNAILKDYGLSVGDASKIKDGDKVISAKDSSVNAWLRNDGKNLFLERELANLSSLSAVKESKIQADIDMLEKMAEDTDIVGNGDKEQVTNLATELKTIKSSTANRSNAELAADMGGANSDILLSAFGVSSGATSAQTRNAVMLDIMETGGAGIVADIKEGASSSANMSSSTSSVMNTINLSNDMSISGRIAQANNPFASYASFDGLLYAAGTSDLPLYYANNGYMNGFWANAIGGLNKVEGENGTLVGLSVGFDRQLENTLVGFYLSYAMAGLNDKVVEQGSDNIQVGVYTSFNQRDIEVNVKAYGQLAVTNTTAKRGAGEAEAKFNRLYGGVSANIGAIFAFNNNQTFVKPYIGENYYYAHTPAYEETRDSDAPLSVQSANNHALSFDVGVDVRQYWNENSFVYLTPSIERYVVNSGGNYTAGFIGSDTSFTIEGKSKTKTYVQALLGGNIALGDKFNVNLGVGVKKILNGQIERANGDKVDEMYLSGNLGVKYRF